MLPALISFLLDDDTHSLCLLGCTSPEKADYLYLGARAPLYSKFKM